MSIIILHLQQAELPIKLIRNVELNGNNCFSQKNNSMIFFIWRLEIYSYIFQQHDFSQIIVYY